jgi:hypothetical protein
LDSGNITSVDVLMKEISIQNHKTWIQEPEIHEIAPDSIKKLARSLIAGAIRDLRKKKSRLTRAKVKCDAFAWFTQGNEEPLSFLWCCIVSGLNSCHWRKLAEYYMERNA